jgi:hypothetical protein
MITLVIYYHCYTTSFLSVDNVETEVAFDWIVQVIQSFVFKDSNPTFESYKDFHRWNSIPARFNAYSIVKERSDL